MLKHWRVNLGGCSHYVVNGDQEDWLQGPLEVSYANAAEVKATKLAFPPSTFATLGGELHALSSRCSDDADCPAFVAHRNGKAFAALPLFPGHFIVMDSHVPRVGVMTVESLVKWVSEGTEEQLGYVLYYWSTKATDIA